MNQDEIMAIATEVYGSVHADDIKFAKLVAQYAKAEEREACAQILVNTDLSGLRDHPLQNWVAGLLFEFIKAIRARGKT